MTTTKTHDIGATLQQIAELTAAGCDIVRVACPTDKDASALPVIAKQSRLSSALHSPSSACARRASGHSSSRTSGVSPSRLTAAQPTGCSGAPSSHRSPPYSFIHPFWVASPSFPQCSPQGAIFRRMASYCSGSAGAQVRVSPPPAVNCPTPTVLQSAKPFFR